MKKILVSVSIIAAVAAVVIGVTTAFFSDTETSTGNTLTAGVIDIVVDDENPWEADFSQELSDMKPSDTRYIAFTVRNLEDSNPINLWKHINITGRSGGVITEPECEEEHGIWNSQSQLCEGESWVPRDNLDPYILYDLYVCPDPVEGQRCQTESNGKPTGTGWEPIISENQYVRLDNVSSIWIKLGQLHPTNVLKVVQSYHLSSWPGAPEADVTNWAQGDVLTFDIELMATQMNAPGPKGAQATLNMDDKDPVTWVPIPGGMTGTLTYKTSGPTFDYDLVASGLTSGATYKLIYYADPYPGSNPGALIGTHIADGSGNITAMTQSVDLGIDLPTVGDANYPAGAKIWLVPASDYNDGNKALTAWNPTQYLFEMNLITYDEI